MSLGSKDIVTNLSVSSGVAAGKSGYTTLETEYLITVSHELGYFGDGRSLGR